MMEIDKLCMDDRKVEVQGTITSKGETRNTKGGDVVCDCILRDETGDVKFPLWGDDIEKVIVGSVVHLENGYTSTYKGELQLNVGKYGKLMVIAENQPAPRLQKASDPKQKPDAKPNGQGRLEGYYAGVKEMQEQDLVGCNGYLKQGWQLEAIKEKHVTLDTPQGLSHQSAIIYVLSRRFD